jgi:hypothetical protein
MTSAAHWRKQSKEEWKFEKIYTMQSFDVPDIKWVERYIVGISTPDRYLTQAEIDKQMEKVNKALRYGRIVSVEQNFTIMSLGKKDIITQYTVYHVGFKQRPPGK